MKYKYFIVFIIIVFTINQASINIIAKDLSENGLYSLSVAALDGDSGRVLFEKNGYDERAMASTTKIMTLIITLEKANLDDIVTVSSYASKMPDVQLNICEGEKYYLKDLLYSLILESHNDTAVAIAEHISGSVENFAVLMNEKAKALSLKNTYFITPNGLDEKDEYSFHHTTAIELAKIMKYCVFDSPQREMFKKICQTKSYSFTDITNKRKYTVNNKNRFMDMYDGVLAGKTGFTADAGYCYVCATEIEGEKIVVALLGAGWPGNKNYKWIDCRNILDYIYQNYRKKQIIDNTYNIPKIRVVNGINKEYIKPFIKDSYSLTMSPTDIIKINLVVPDYICAPINYNQIIGRLDILIDNHVIKTIPVYSDSIINKINYKFVLSKYIKRIFSY